MENQEKKIKVLHVLTEAFLLPYFIGNQFFYFTDKNYELYVACSASKDADYYAKYYGFNLCTIYISRKITVFTDVIALFRVYQLIKLQDIDIIVGHTPKGALISMLASYFLRKKKRIYMRHTILYETSKGIKRCILKKIEQITGLCATHVINVSKYVEEFSVSHKLNKPSKNRFLNKGTCNGIDSHYFNKENYGNEQVINLKKDLGIEDSDFIVGYVGRLVRDKGVNELVEAFVMLSKHIKNIKLVLVGKIEDRDSILPETLNIIYQHTNIVYVPHQKDIAFLYTIMNVLVLPSYREGFGLAAVEASSMCVPVIVSYLTGVREAIIPNVTGIYTEINSLSICEAIKYYYFNPIVAKIHGDNGRSFVVSDFNQKKVWHDIENVYLE